MVINRRHIFRSNRPITTLIVCFSDTPGHMKMYADFTSSTIINFLQNVTSLINQSFPDVTAVMALGNHDYYPINELPGNQNVIYEAAADMWRPWFGESQTIVDTFIKGNYPIGISMF